jgi:microcystin-dependent protein
MRKASCLLAVLLTLALAAVAADKTPGNDPKQVVIVSTEADYAIGKLFIKGRNFGVTTPGVTLNGLPLTVMTSTSGAGEIQAMLPAGIAPGSYLLVVSFGTNASDVASFDATIGAAGPVGPKGDKGDTGTTGSQGLKGDTGARGDTGAQGPKGDTGATGSTGAAGPEGPQGQIGPTGPQGAKGDAGNTGAIGATGPQGPQGEVGPTGAPGPKGDTGATGATGATGVAGPEGPQGQVGPGGPQGPQGPKGDTGVTGAVGATGAQGPQGEVGATGAQGPKGDTGLTGATGGTGAQGPQGEPGSKGEKGDAGAAGPAGVQGEQGPPGLVNLPFVGASTAATPALDITSSAWAAIKVTSTAQGPAPGTGIGLLATGADAGVRGHGTGTDGTGLLGQSDTGVGVRGSSEGTLAGNVNGSRVGVWGTARQGFGVRGTSDSGSGMFGFSRGGAGVEAHSETGVGVYAAGGKAPIVLRPSNTVGPPQTNFYETGTLYVDSVGDLFVRKTDGSWAGTATPGPAGPQGPQGPRGDIGATGPQGLRGETGPAGSQGDDGPAGLQGPKGDAGPAGPQGTPGLPGFVTLPFSGTGDAGNWPNSLLTITSAGYSAWAIAGKSTGANGSGLYGEAPAFGVVGRSSAAWGIAVRGDAGGTNLGAGRGNIGVEGIGGNYGVYGAGRVGVRGDATGGYDGADRAGGVGVEGLGATYGVVARGTTAPLLLERAGTAGPPSSGIHRAGELFVDAGGVLFYCKVSGTPGTWVALDEAGPVGPAGPSGATGAIGPQGPQGVPGDQGPAGPAGPQGPTGPSNPVGTVLTFAGRNAPDGYLICDGRMVSRSQYAALFAVIGDIYGSGDLVTTFHLPDMRGRATIGAGASTGLSARTVGDRIGAERHTLTVTEMPSHDHQPLSPSTYFATVEHGVAGGHLFGGGSWARQDTRTASTGGGQSHNNMQPSIVMNYIIKY